MVHPLRMSPAEREFHRKAATHCFNQAWDLMVMKDRSAAEDSQLLHLAHTSRYHWGLVGGPRQRAVSDWQLSRVYAALHEPRLAVKFARSCLGASRRHRLRVVEETAYEALARAYATSKDYRRARKCLDRAQTMLDKLDVDEEDRKIFQGQLSDTRAMIKTSL